MKTSYFIMAHMAVFVKPNLSLEIWNTFQPYPAKPARTSRTTTAIISSVISG
jgi:hypothetical protein